MGESEENEMALREFSNSVNSSANKSGGDMSPDLGFHSHMISPIVSELVEALPPPPPPSSSPVQRKKSGPGVGSGNQKRKRSVSAAGSDDHNLHILTERERRKKMRDMFSNLHALLPQLTSKADKSTIVNEAVISIKSLQQTLEQLIQRKKVERDMNGIGPDHLKYDIIPPKQKLITDHIEETRDDQSTFMVDYVCNHRAIVSGSGSGSRSGSSNSFPPGLWTWASSNVVLNVLGEQAQYSIYALNNNPGLLSAICHILDNHKIQLLTCNIVTHHGCTMYTIHANGTTPDAQLPEGFPVEEIYKQVALEMSFLATS
ncbi:transcription factor bHLH95-like [Impatiens glandulifera]|uniref:transcription factor bHLH95-like n=1 Tax=Impatiens glandulifera TaxID=253017 RepID=UPI001FB0B870|nr:transcription factor bHLH95-like [Impatiens glandulifera]